ncbi:MAG TPA: anti-sigma factor [Anaeromyxobacter sp.]|nr:anti-sigma factor [Anaeromyxobacter sp.]
MTKIPGEKVVAGLSCGEVLDRLSDYLDRELPQDGRDRLEAHLRGCEQCARFGGDFAATVRALKEHLGAERLPSGFQDRLRRAIDRGQA